jgi:hypothetical protein
VLWTMHRSAMPSFPAGGARTYCTYLKRMHPAPANDGTTFMGNAFGAAAYLAELLPTYVSRAVSQMADPPKRP